MSSKALALPPNLTVEERKSKGHEAVKPTSGPKRQPSLRHGQIPETLMGLGLWLWGLRGQGSLTQLKSSTSGQELEDKGYQAEYHCHRTRHWISEGSTPAFHPLGRVCPILLQKLQGGRGQGWGNGSSP